MKMIKLWLMCLVTAMVAILPLTESFADTPLDPDNFVIIDGLGSDMGCDYDGSGLSKGQVGISKEMDIRAGLSMAGAIQVFYDDGRLSGNNPACVGRQQVYSLDQRLGANWRGITNTSIAVRFPSLCSQGSCHFATSHICARVQGDGTINEDQFNFPCKGDEAIVSSAQPNFPTDGRLQSEWTIFTGSGTGNNDEQVQLVQMVQLYDGEDHFDLTWKLRSTSDAYSYDNVKFYYSVDTFTSGVDFGYGYTCDICPIAGASGGSVFFQGLIGLHSSFKQAEHSWGHVFYTMAEDEIPHYSTNPLNGDADDPAPLAELKDNALVQQWGCDPTDSDDSDNGCEAEDTLTVSSTPTYISARWTFEDPIRMSTYGTAQALLELNYDDKTTLFDVHFDPTDWRGFINTYSNPVPCQKDEECTGTGETCLKQPGCIDADIPCPRFCAKQTCNDDDDCLGRFCLFGFCVDRKWEVEEDMTKGTGNSSRDIVVMKSDGSFSSFTGGNSSEFSATMGVDDTEAARIINWARGQIMNPGTDVITDNDDHSVDLMRTSKMRNRDGHVLGDITHARPVFVGHAPLNPGFLDSQDKIAGKRGYSEYVNSAAYMEKTQLLLVASNDGMLHALEAETGEELWAIVPEAVLPRLPQLAKPYYEKLRLPMLDLTPLAVDVFKYDSSDALNGRWATVAIIGMRGGGNEYYAIDITDPKNPNPLWVFSDPDMGQTYARPAVARVELDDSTGKEAQVVLFGSGYADSSALQFSKTGYIYAVDLFAPPSSGAPQLLAKINVDNSAYGNVVTGAVVIDEDRDGYDEKAYMGDLAGNMWRVYLVGGGGSLSVENSLLYSAGGTITQTVYNRRLGAGGTQEYTYEKYLRPISGMPTAAFAEADGVDFMGDAENTNKVIVMFGSGKFDSFYDSFDMYVENPDASEASQTYYYQNIYGVVDRAEMSNRGEATVTEGNLQHNTLRTFDGDGIEGRFRTIDSPDNPSCSDDGDGCKGWRIELQSTEYNRGERIVTDPQYVGGTLFLTTFTPNGQGTCDIRGVEGSGGGYLMAINYQNGGNPNDATLDKNLNGIVNEDDNVGGDYIAGMRFTGGILSSPVVDAVSGAVYFKTGTDVMPTKVNISPMGSFRGATTVLYRVKY